jgi:hypothetical protein
MVAACPTTVISSRCPRALIRRTQNPLSSLWKVTRSTRPARTSWVDGSCCGFMSIIVSSASALGTPIPWHIEVTGPDVCATLPGGHRVGCSRVRRCGRRGPLVRKPDRWPQMPKAKSSPLCQCHYHRPILVGSSTSSASPVSPCTSSRITFSVISER